MDLKQVASLILRQAMALTDEGIGSRRPEASDQQVLEWALTQARPLFDEHDLWDALLIRDEEHMKSGCERHISDEEYARSRCVHCLGDEELESDECTHSTQRSVRQAVREKS